MTVTIPTPTAAPARRPRLEWLTPLLRSGSFVCGAVITLFWVVCAIFGPHFVPYDPYLPDLLNTLSPPDGDHWFGTDQLGRDVFSRVIVGSRDILTFAPLATLLGTVLGTTLGLITGYFRGIIDDAISRVIEAVLALPVVIVALLVLVSVGPSNTAVVLVIGVVFAPQTARTVRSAVIVERGLDYVAAAQLRNESALYIMAIEILPNVLAPVLVETTVRLGYAIFTVATLSFLGFGIQPPSADWGLAVSENYSLLAGHLWWPVVFPASATALLIIGVNLLVDGIHAALEG
jgi:peptide/nickel transport system permease protein